MKRIMVLVALLAVVIVIRVPKVSAHELRTDANIGAVLHIEPDDDPVVGTPQSFDLFFQDLTNRFTLPDCVCKIELFQNGQVAYSASPHITGRTTSMNPYTFTKAGIYSFIVTGTPKQPGNFQPFKLTYPIRTESTTSTTTQPLSTSLVAGLVLLQILIILALYNFLHP